MKNENDLKAVYTSQTSEAAAAEEAAANAPAEETDGPAAEAATADTAKADLVFAAFLLALSVYVLVSGNKMPSVVYTGDPKLWYTGPGAFPIFIGTMLGLFSVMYFYRSWRRCGGVGAKDLASAAGFLKSAYTVRLLLSIGLLAVYVFLLLGRIPFFAATILYLFVSMMVLRKKTFAVWKILLISSAITALITYGFGTLASIPLP